MPPTVSVVIPTRNRPMLTLRALRSALRQSVSNVEVIVVDDASTDDTSLVVSGVSDSRVKMIHLDHPSGAARARNVGLSAANSPFVAFLDSDDTWHEAKLEQQLAVAGPTTVVSCQVRRVRGEHVVDVVPDHPPIDSIVDYLFVARGLLQTSTLLLSTALAREVGFDPGLRRHHDYDFCLRLESLGAHFKLLEKPLVDWHVEPDRARISTSADLQATLEWFSSSSVDWSKAAKIGFEVREVLPRLPRSFPDRLMGLRIAFDGARARSLSPSQAVRWAVRMVRPR